MLNDSNDSLRAFNNQIDFSEAIIYSEKKGWKLKENLQLFVLMKAFCENFIIFLNHLYFRTENYRKLFTWIRLWFISGMYPVSLFVYIYIYIYIYTYLYKYIYMYTYVYIYIRVCISIYLFTYVYIYIYIYIYKLCVMHYVFI